MNTETDNYIQKYCVEIRERFYKIKELIQQSVPFEVEEKLWANLPSYYAGEKFVRLIPFKDHINIEAESIKEYTDELKGYKITPKGMLQIYLNQDIPNDMLESIFRKTLLS